MSNWQRWGPEDEAGTLNLVDTGAVLQGVDAVRRGQVVSLAQPIGPGTSVAPHRYPPRRFLDRDAGDYATGARSPDGFRFAEDTVVLATHSGTHLDALAHAWTGDTLYNGHPAASIRSTRGATRCGADKLRPIVTRGVLIDLVTLHGGPLAPGTPVGAADLEAVCRRHGTEIRSADAVLLRTGWWETQGETAAYHDNEPGITDEAAHWLAERDVAVVGADNYAIEVQPSAPGTTFPVHLTLLHRYGVPLLENLDLAGLAAHEAQTFLFVAAPLSLAGSTASPLTPVAVL